MSRAALLTWRMHRFEVFASIVAIVVVAVSAWVVRDHLLAFSIPETCKNMLGYSPPPSSCTDIHEAYLRLQGEVSLLMGGAATILPFVMGLTLGVPIVGREIEMRTTTLAWSLSGDRLKWLVQRLLPMLAIGLTGLVVLGLLLREVHLAKDFEDFESYASGSRLWHLGSYGATFAGRGLMAFGVAVLAGAVVGRTLPGFVVAGALGLGLLFVGPPALQGAIAEPNAVWVEDKGFGESPDYLLYLESRLETLDGQLVDENEAYQVAEEMASRACRPRCEGEEFQFKIEAWMEANFRRSTRVVPLEAFPVFEFSETAVTTGIGVLGILLTFPVVARKRPA